jgi:hypothetical protein
MIIGSLSRLPQATRQGLVVRPRHKGVFPRCGGARHPGLCAGLTGVREQAERATAADNYWSSTSNAANPSNAWNVNFNDGNVNANDKNNTFRARAVRGGR